MPCPVLVASVFNFPGSFSAIVSKDTLTSKVLAVAGAGCFVAAWLTFYQIRHEPPYQLSSDQLRWIAELISAAILIPISLRGYHLATKKGVKVWGMATTIRVTQFVSKFLQSAGVWFSKGALLALWLFGRIEGHTIPAIWYYSTFGLLFLFMGLSYWRVVRKERAKKAQKPASALDALEALANPGATTACPAGHG